jgi:XTP/dITP diphosphohydrolase
VSGELLELVLASANPDKVAEIRSILADALGDRVTILARPDDVPEVVEDGETLEDNARLKAVALCDATGRPAVADDTGLEVDALGGAPGVYAARYSGEDATYASNVAKLLTQLDAAGARAPSERGAQFRTIALARFPDGRELVADGVVRGTIAAAPEGDGGFGYDPVFRPDEADGRTFAAMAPGEKHAISHRGRAFRALAALIGDHISAG